MSMDALFAQAQALLAQAPHNLNLVTPDHFWPHLRELVRRLRGHGVTAPVIYNCSGYTLPEMVPELAESVDIFMPDIKFADPALADLCMSAQDYPSVAFAALDKMVEERGFLEPFDLTGSAPAQRGVLVRHLVLPGQVKNSLTVLRRLRQQFGRMLPISVMSQYRPMPECRRRGLFTRRVSAAEYRQVCDLIADLNFEQVFTQPIFDDDGYVPDFSCDTPFRGGRA